MLGEYGERCRRQADDEASEPKYVDALRSEGWLEGGRGSKHGRRSVGRLVCNNTQDIQSLAGGILLKLRERDDDKGGKDTRV